MEFKELEKLIKIFQNSNLENLEWKKNGEELILKKAPKDEAPVANVMPALLPESTTLKDSPPAETIKQTPVAVESGLYYISAPFVGTFYRSASPDSSPFMNVGDKVKKGDVLCIIEAMKLMNEIESDVAGTVVDIMIENAHPVEFGTNMIAIRPE